MTDEENVYTFGIVDGAITAIDDCLDEFAWIDDLVRRGVMQRGAWT